MATSKVGMVLEAKATGLNEINKTASELNKNLTSAQKAANSLSNTKFAAAAAKRESEDYGVSRSLRPGGTGASGRDFAQEAQGLGGVVRLYATYAANIFAAGAAFRALSAAMDTTNMVRGLDQLGAASGTSLGSLSKQLVKATDGAISLREAMESVAKASSSGMSSENILRMGKVAKQASQALGVDMSDAVNRLTRGITKLEPELLDEVGIFTRVDTAVKEYAKSVGKSTTAITDFERRMAFANAVLTEGEKKFSAINFETNPYTKLVATLKDVAQNGLEVINKVLSPLVGFLSESPTALSVALAAIGTALIRQALPSVGKFKEALVSSAEEAKELSIKKAQEAQDAITKIRETAIKKRESLADSELDSVIAQQKAIKDLRESGIKTGSSAFKLLDTDFTDFTKQGIEQFEKRVKSVETSLKSATTSFNKLSADPNADQVKLQAAQRLIEINTQSLDIAKRARLAEQQLADETAKSSKTSIVARLTQQAALKAEEQSIKQTVLANAAYNASLIGVGDAMRLARAEIDASGLSMTRLQKGALLARVGIASIGGAITTVASAISNLMGIVGVFIAAGTLIYSTFTKNDKQAQEFTTSIDRSNESLRNLARTLDVINQKPFGQQFSTESLLARANAIKEVGDSILDTTKNLKATDAAASAFDKFIDGYKTLWGGDLRSTFSRGVAATLTGAIQQLDSSPEAIALRKKVAEILNIGENFNTQQLAQAIAKVADNAPLMEKLAKATQKIGFEAQVSANKLKELDDAIKVAGDAYKSLEAKFKVNDPLEVLGSSLVSSATKMAQAFEAPETAIQKLAEVASDFEKLRLFGEEDQANLIKYKKLLEDAKTSYGQITTVTNTLRQQIAEVNAKMEETRTKVNQNRQEQYKQSDTGIAKYDSEFAANLVKLNKLKSELATQESALSQQRANMVQLQAKFPDIAYNQFAKGANIVQAAIVAGAAKGGNALAEAAANILGDLPGTAALKADLEKQKIAADNALIKVNLDLIKATRENTAQIAVQVARERNADAQKLDPGERARFGLSNTENELKDAEDYLKLVKTAGTGTKAAIDSIKTAWKEGSDDIKAKSQELLNYVSTIAGLTAQQTANFSKLQAIDLNKAVGTLKEQEKLEKDKLASKQKALDVEAKSLQLLGRAGSLSEIDLAARKESLVAQQNQNNLQALELQYKYENQATELAIAALKRAGVDKEAVQRAERELGDKKAIQAQDLIVKKQEASNALMDAKLETQEAIYKKLLQEKETTERIVDIQNNAYISSIESQERLSEMRFQEAESTYGLLEEEKLLRKFLFDQDKARTKIKLETLKAELSYQKEMADLNKKETLDNLEDIQREREARAKSHAARLSEIVAEGAQELKTIQAGYDYSKNKEIVGALAESVVTGITSGAKEGAKVLRNFIEKELKRKLTIQVEAEISKSDLGKAATASTDFISTVLGGYETYALGDGLTKGLTQLGDNLIKNGFGDLGLKIGEWGVNLTQYTDILNGVGVGLSAVTAALEGDYGSAIGQGIGYYFGGPIGAAIGNIIGSALGLTDDSGTYHTGGAGSYSTTQGQMKGTSVEQALNFNLAGQNVASAEDAAANISQTLVSIFESVAQTFGNEAGYYAATAFADDTSKDGAWGALMVKLNDEILVDWKQGMDKWPGREFANGEAGQKEYLNAIAKDTIEVLKKMELPDWATDILNKVGETPTMETLQNVLGQINLLNNIFTTFSANLGFTKESLESLIGPLGGIQAATQKLSFFYDNFYTNQEKVKNSTIQLSDSFTKLGLELPTSVAGFKQLVLSAEAAGDEVLVNNLLTLAPAFKALADASEDIADLAEEATDRIEKLASSVGLAAESLASTITSSFMNGVNGAEIGKVIANTIQRGMYQAMIQGVAQEISNLVASQIINPMLSSIITSGTIVGAVSEATIQQVVEKATAMIGALAEVLNSPAFQDAIAQLGQIANINFGGINVPAAYTAPSTTEQAKDPKEEALKNLDDAFKVLKAAVDKQKGILQDQLKAAEETRDKLKQIYDTLDSNIKELRNEVSSTAGLASQEGQQYLNSILTSGVLGDPDKLEEAIGAVRSGIDNATYASQFEADRAKLVLAGQLDAIKLMAGNQLSDAELQIAALNTQITQLDELLQSYEDQINVLKGIDTSVLSVADAIAALQAAMTSVSTPGGGGSGGGSSGSTTPSLQMKGFMQGLTKDYTGIYNSGTVSQANGQYTYTSTQTDAGGFSGVQSPSDSLTSARPWTTTGYAANNPDVVQYYGLNKALISRLGQGNTLEDYLNYHFITYGISEGRKFAKGGIFDNGVVTQPTAFDVGLMGEAGAEAIVPLTRGSNGSLGVTMHGTNAELVAEIRELRMQQENSQRQIAHLMTKVAKSTEESRKLLDDVVRGGESIAVTSEIASY